MPPPQASEEKCSMDYFAGLDVSAKETSVCIVDDAGKIVREARVTSEPDLAGSDEPSIASSGIRLEAGPLSQWLYSVLAEAGLPVICVETQHMRAMLKARSTRPQRCARGSTDDAGALSSRARKDVTQSEA
jgi:transposase